MKLSGQTLLTEFQFAVEFRGLGNIETTVHVCYPASGLSFFQVLFFLLKVSSIPKLIHRQL